MSKVTKQRAPKQMHVKYSMHALLYVLKEKGANKNNPIHWQKILPAVQEYLINNGLLKKHDLTLNKSGDVRWEKNLDYYFIELRAGNFAHRKDGYWSITKEGKDVVEKGPDVVRRLANVAFKEYLDKKQLKETK